MDVEPLLLSIKERNDRAGHPTYMLRCKARPTIKCGSDLAKEDFIKQRRGIASFVPSSDHSEHCFTVVLEQNVRKPDQFIQELVDEINGYLVRWAAKDPDKIYSYLHEPEGYDNCMAEPSVVGP